MIHKTKSNSKFSPIKHIPLTPLKYEEPLLKGKWDQIPVKSKSSTSLRKKSSVSLKKSKRQQQKQGKQNMKGVQRHIIQKQYTKQTFKRFQQKLNICSKMQQLIGQIKQRQAKLKSFFQIYRILQSEAGQQRCLQHNNDLSLYCQTENRVLCVHCIYGASKHKTHKVVPLKDCIKQISKDNLNLQQTVLKDIETIRMKIKISQMNESFLERHFRKQLMDLEKKYNEKLHEIQVDYCEKKKYLNQYFEQIIKKNEELTNSLKVFQQNISLKLGILGRDQNSSKHVQAVKQISKQTILTKISQLSNISSLYIQGINEKDIGQNAMRSRIKINQK